jgi:hypothetical protein
MSQSCRPLIVDADGHVCEPPDLWERNLPASMRERGPRVRWSDPDGCEQVLVEDTIVRSTTMKSLLHHIRERGGAREIHVRIACPPIIAPCFIRKGSEKTSRLRINQLTSIPG